MHQVKVYGPLDSVLIVQTSNKVTCGTVKHRSTFDFSERPRESHVRSLIRIVDLDVEHCRLILGLGDHRVIENFTGYDRDWTLGLVIMKHVV